MLAALLWAACVSSPHFVRTVTFKDSTRVERFQYGVSYYMKLMDVKVPVQFVVGAYPQHPEYCGWVVRNPKTAVIEVGYHDSPECQQLKPEWVSMHEACHLRMAHTMAPFDVSMPPDKKEQEVAECMKGYSGRTLR